MARPSTLDVNALGAASFGESAPIKSVLVTGPIADALKHSIDNNGADVSFIVPENQVQPLIGRIRNTARNLGNHSVRITVTVIAEKGVSMDETVIKQGQIRKDGKRTIKVYFRAKSHG